MIDKIIEYKSKQYSLRKILDSKESWKKYLNGSDNFRKAVEMGVLLQLAELDHLFGKLNNL